MGTGKSTLGRAVSRALARPFADTDAEVVARAGRAIPALFAAIGEAGFRDLEAAVVADLGAAAGAVLATGGGALGRAGNLEALRARGVLVALSARPEVILSRVGGAEAARRRPLLGGGDPLARIRYLLGERAAAYAQADLHLDTSLLRRERAVVALLELCAARAGAIRRGG